MNDCPNPMKAIKLGRWFITYQMAVKSWGVDEGDVVTRHIFAVDVVTQDKVTTLRLVIFKFMLAVGRWPY